jgi:hypothetical protein
MAYREAVAGHTHTHLDALLTGTRPAVQQVTYAVGRLLVKHGVV